MAKLKRNKKISELKNKNIGSTMFLVVASNRSKYTERIYAAIAVFCERGQNRLSLIQEKVRYGKPKHFDSI